MLPPSRLGIYIHLSSRQLRVVTAAITPNFCLSVSFFGITVFIIFVTEHGSVFVLLRSRGRGWAA